MGIAKEKLPDYLHNIVVLDRFVSNNQWNALRELVDGEEGEFFADKVIEYGNRITSMPATYQTDGQGDDAICHLHYFSGACDWYIIEKDCEMPQHQAFGWCDLGMGCPELGYVSIEELKGLGVELDLHWEPKPLREVKQL